MYECNEDLWSCFLFFLPTLSFCYLQPLSNAYHELAQVYTTNNPSELRSLVNKHSETFTRDNNTGLVKQCLSSLYKKNIQRLTKVGGCRHFQYLWVILSYNKQKYMCLSLWLQHIFQINLFFVSCRPSWHFLCKTWQVECSCQVHRKQRNMCCTWWVRSDTSHNKLFFFFLSSGHEDHNTQYSNCFPKHIFYW